MSIDGPDDDFWEVPPDLDTSRAHPGRVYAHFLGGKDTYLVDREAADALEAVLPDVPRMARANRNFMLRAVSRLVGTHGIRQLIDIGSGFPVSPNLHEVAQVIDPLARVVYVDNDALVGTYSRALFTSTRNGRIKFLLGDATCPDAILASSTLSKTLDLSEPVALMLASVLMYFDDDTVRRIVDTLMDALPSGSYLTISHPTGDFAPDVVAKAAEVGRAAGLTYIPRTRSDVEKLFGGVKLCEPGVVAMAPYTVRHRRRPRLVGGINALLGGHGLQTVTFAPLPKHQDHGWSAFPTTPTCSRTGPSPGSVSWPPQ